MRNPWTDSQKATLRQLWADGIAVALIAERLGHPIHSVTGTAASLKLGVHPSKRRSGEPENRICGSCGKPFSRRPDESVNDFARRIYCDRKCYRQSASALNKNIEAAKRHRRRIQSKRQREHIAEFEKQWYATAVAQPANLSAGRVESIADYLARGGRITRCPSAYAAPVEHAMAGFGRRSGGRRG